MNTYIVEFARTVVIDVEEGMTVDDIKDIAWQEFGAGELLHSEFDITEIIEAETV